MKKAIIKRAAAGLLMSALLCAAAIPASAATQQGIDISHYDGAVDFSELKTDSHGQFVYIKATEGEHTTDAWFTRNSQSAASAGVAWGPYHFFRAYSVASAQTQAEHFWRAIKGTGYTLRPVVDVETADGQQRAADVRTILQAFCDRFRQLSGEYPVIYSYTSYINEYSLAKQFGGYLLWQAQYGPTRADTGWTAQVWQYSDKGTVAGVTAPTVDLNVLYDTSVYESGQAVAASAAPYPYIIPVARGDNTRRTVRTSASWSARTVGRVSVGDRYEIMGPTSKSGWVQIGLGGRPIGYVSAYVF